MRIVGLIVAAIFLLTSCEKDEKKYDPIQIQSQVKNVTVNGASDGEITLTVVGGKEPYSFLWSNGANTKDITGLKIGSYAVVLTDANGDTASHSASVTEPTELTASVKKTNTTKLGNADGTAELTITGGIPPYAVIWNTSATSTALTGLAAGSYTADITDANKATKQIAVVISDPVTLTLVATNTNSFGGTNGSVNLTIAGGTPPFTIVWNSGQTTEDISSLKAGYYSATVTDAAEVKATSSVEVVEPYNIVSDISSIINHTKRLNQSGVRIEYNSKVIYIDPINTGGYSADADIILVTHSHGDHFSTSVISKLIKADTKVMATDECQVALSKIVGAINLFSVVATNIDTLSDIRIEVVHAYNSNHVSAHSVGYILTLNGKRVYHSGDTKKIPEMDSYNADIAFLPMGQTYTFTSIEEAANAARAVGAELVVPMHYSMYEGKTQDAWTFKQTLINEIQVFVMQPITQ